MRLLVLAMGLGLGMTAAAGAQAPSGAPAGATGICKDGTYSTAASKDGACRGHKGVQTWYAAGPKTMPTPAATTSQSLPAPTPAASNGKAMPTATPAASTSAAVKAPRQSPAAAAAAKTAAPGGGPGLVWVNTTSNVYHCYGGDFYGKTKEGKYMSEGDAKATGARPSHNQACGK